MNEGDVSPKRLLNFPVANDDGEYVGVFIENTTISSDYIVLNRQELENIIQDAIKDRINVLYEEIRNLRAQIDNLKKQVPGPDDVVEDHRELHEAYSLKFRKIEEKLELLNAQSKDHRNITIDRLNMIEHILKDQKTISLKELRLKLGVSKQHLSYLVNQLDRREYAILPHPHDKRQHILKKLR